MLLLFLAGAMATSRVFLGDVHLLPPSKAPAPAMGLLYYQLFCWWRVEQLHVECWSPSQGSGYGGMCCCQSHPLSRDCSSPPPAHFCLLPTSLHPKGTSQQPALLEHQLFVLGRMVAGAFLWGLCLGPHTPGCCPHPC